LAAWLLAVRGEADARQDIVGLFIEEVFLGGLDSPHIGVVAPTEVDLNIFGVDPVFVADFCQFLDELFSGHGVGMVGLLVEGLIRNSG
jgi:hypothetical protein